MGRRNLKKILFMFVSCLLIACVKEKENIDWREEFSKLGPMGKASSTFADTHCIGKCQWTSIDHNTLGFEGKIEEGSYRDFMEKINDDIKEIRLNSSGGVVQSALKIGDEIYRRKLKVVVSGFCVSSCANYLFLAGGEKVMNGVLGFHGSSQAALKQSKYCEKNKDRPACDFAIREHEFFKKIGIAESLFDITQSSDKGMADGRVYVYYAPSKTTLSKLGVTAIAGDQNEDFLKKMEYLQKKFQDNYFSVARDPNPAILKSLQVK